MCIPYEHMPKFNVKILNFEQLLKHILRVFPSLGGGGGGKFNSVGLDYSGSQPFLCNDVILIVNTNSPIMGIRSSCHLEWL